MIIVLIISVVILFIVGLVFLGLYLKSRLIKKLIQERDDLDLRTQQGKDRLRILNSRIDKIYGYKR